MNKIVPVILLFFFISGSFVAAFQPVSASGLVENTCNTKTSMNQARGGLGVVAVNGKVYAIGGIADGHVLVGTNEQYDPVSDTWVTLEPMPTPRAYFAIAVYQSNIYCIGGTSYNAKGEWDACAVNEIYDTLTNHWSTKMSFPSDEKWLHAQVVGEQIFVSKFPELFMYDPIEDTWSTKTSMPVYPASEPVWAVVGDKIMVTCRYLAGSPTVAQKVMIYDTKSDLWSERKTGPTLIDDGVKAGVTTGVYAPQRVYVFFGTLDTLVYDFINDSWSSAQAMSIDRRRFGVAVVDDVLYVIGGFSQVSVPSAVNEQYVPVWYNAVPIDTEPSGSLVTSEPEPSKTPSTYLIATILTIIVVTFATGLFLYFKKRNKKGDTT